MSGQLFHLSVSVCVHALFNLFIAPRQHNKKKPSASLPQHDPSFVLVLVRSRSGANGHRQKPIVSRREALYFHKRAFPLLYCKFNRAWTNFYSLYDYFYTAATTTSETFLLFFLFLAQRWKQTHFSFIRLWRSEKKWAREKLPPIYCIFFLLWEKAHTHTVPTQLAKERNRRNERKKQIA